MATELSQKFTATLSNNYNSSAYTYQGGYSSTTSTGATCTSRKGYFAFSGLSSLADCQITKIEWYISYASAGKDDLKTLTFTTPSTSFRSTVAAYGNSETKTLTSGNAFFDSIYDAINGSGSVTWTMYNGETTTTHTASSGSYTENYLYVNSSYIVVYYKVLDGTIKYATGGSYVDCEVYYATGGSFVKVQPYYGTGGSFVQLGN